jgi:hypothetical protein
LSDEEMYAGISGVKLSDVLATLTAIVDANSELERFHSVRRGNDN